MMSHKTKVAKFIKLGPFYYKFRLGLTILTILAVFILAYLGIWQLGRSFEKKVLFAELKKKADGIPTRMNTISAPKLKTHRFTPVLIQGTYLNPYTFLLDNQVFQHTAGFRVLTVFQSPYLDKWIMVDRGWIARNPSHDNLPPIQEIYGVQVIQGVINTIPTGIVLKKDEYKLQPNWPVVIQALDYELIAKFLQHPIYDFVVQLESETQVGAYKIPPIEFGMPSDKHLGYAMQWFMFALLVLIYYILHSFKRTKD